MAYLNSSAILSADYSGGVLTVTFTTGRTYHHPGVPYSVYVGLVNASSPGRYYNAYIRGRYR